VTRGYLKGLVLAGGHGTRLRPLTFAGNKHMLPIANRPMIEYSIDHLREAGITDVGMILGPIAEGIKESLGDGSRLGVKLTYIEQREPKGLAHAVLTARNFLGEDDFVMYLGDNLLEAGAKQFVEAFKGGGFDCVLGGTRVKEPERYGVIVMHGNEVVRVVEKPKEFISDVALIGVYVFNKRIHEAIKRIRPSWRNELEITDAIQTLLNENARVKVIPVAGWWKDAGRTEDLLDANKLVLSRMQSSLQGLLEPGTLVEGHVALGEGSVVRSGSSITGPVIIGKGCTVGSKAQIGPFVSIGDRCTIDNSIIVNSIVMEECRMLDAGKIMDSLVGRGSVISRIDGTSNSKKMVVGEKTVIEG
jgi:glucose-1-phosphate thymidylyltransferase